MEELDAGEGGFPSWRQEEGPLGSRLSAQRPPGLSVSLPGLLPSSPLFQDQNIHLLG